MQFLRDEPQWAEQFAEERGRLIGALGLMIEGGIIERLEHIGATSVPGALARPCIDIGLSVWPFPLDARCQAAVAALGYTRASGYEDAHEQRFCHATGAFALYVIEAGSERWSDCLILRDYLREVVTAREAYSRRKGELAEGEEHEAVQYEASMALLFQEMLTIARSWWVDARGLAPVHAIVQELTELPVPWCIASGWALDLFLGRVTRVHQDVDVVIAYADQLVLQQHLMTRGWTLLTPLDGRLEAWPVHMQVVLPRHQVHAHRGSQFLDVLLTQMDKGVWRYRRNPQIIQSVERAILRTADGIPILAPELVLLFKSRNTSGRERSKDQADFERMLEQLAPERRAWLRWALMVEEPNHPWLEVLR